MNCRLCGKNNTERLFSSRDVHGRHVVNHGDLFNIYRCNDCEVLFVADIVVDDNYYKRYYTKDYYDLGPENPFLRLAAGFLQKISVSGRIKKILKYAKPSKGFKLKILDIGCGRGEFLTRLPDKFFEKHGLEINPDGVKASTSAGIHVIKKDIKECTSDDGTYDIVTMWHVIEHLNNPDASLESAGRLLKSGGVLIVSTPNIDSFGFSFSGPDWFHLDSPRHLILYGEAGLMHLLARHGFDCLEIFSSMFDCPLDLFWSLRNHKVKYFVYPLYLIFKFLSGETFSFVCRKR